MRRPALVSLPNADSTLAIAAALVSLAGAAPRVSAQARQQASSAMQATRIPRADLETFAQAAVAIAAARDSMQAQISAPKNAKTSAQQEIRAHFQSQVAEILHHAGLSEADFDKKTYIVSADSTTRHAYDSLVAKISGQPIPSVYVPANLGPQVKVPATAAGMHIGHVVNTFNDTPDSKGLLPIALSDARVAAQHAQLAARNPTNLDAIKLHAGHVLNALDPSIVPTGPGSGYGLKKAAAGIATHIELAAKAAGATPNIETHAAHIATAARNTVTRADQCIALAKEIQAATTADDAMKLLNQLIPLTQQLTAGADTNNDGKVSIDEGGLQMAQEHVTLMLAAEKLP
ncbi:MAG TPA: DUF4168 domain-containing protein [Gemmatimonadaceae bacterium]|nr:DUF4168 domain-containing protein [Gemmatimonadaceae bacterium]